MYESDKIVIESTIFVASENSIEEFIRSTIRKNNQIRIKQKLFFCITCL